MGIILGLDQAQRDIGFEIEDIVGTLGLSAAYELAADDDAAIGEAHLLADLQHLIPARLAKGGRDELGADVAFAEVALIHDGQPSPARAVEAVGATIISIGEQ